MMERLGIDTNLGIWLMADIESRGAVTLTEFEDNYLAAGDQMTDWRRTTFTRALSLVSATAHPHLRPAINSTVRRLVSRDPQAAALVVAA